VPWRSAQHIMLGRRRHHRAGGQENMSMSPHAAHLRAGREDGRPEIHRHHDPRRLWDAFNGYHMGKTAENVAEQWQISRDSRTNSPSLAEQGGSRAEGRQVRRRDRPPSPSRAARATSSSTATNTSATAPRWRHGQAAPGLHKEGTVTAANASGINDGAAATC
jgi:acetyl-CoA C-acetyltransferase